MTQLGQMSTAVVFEDRPEIINHFGNQIKRERKSAEDKATVIKHSLQSLVQGQVGTFLLFSSLNVI